MKHILLIVAVTLPIAACSKEQPKKVEIRPVRVTSVQHTSSGDTISLTAQIQAKDPVNLAFRIGGRLQERNVTVGDPVSPGQIVARIESQDYQNALRSAEADLASAHAVLANAQATESRQSELLSKGFATRVQYNQAEQQLKTTQAQVESAQAKTEAIILPLYLIALPYFFGLPRLGGVIPILIFAVPFVLSVSGLSLVVAAIFKNPLSVQLVLAAIGMPFFFLAGFAWPAEVMPPAVHVASLLVPSTSATNGFTWLAQLGAPLADVRGEFLMLWGLTIRRYRLDPGSQEAVDRTAETRESLWHDIDGLHVFVEQIRNGFSSGKIS